MVAPLVMAGLGGLALSGGANLYAQHNSRKLYSRQLDAYRRLDAGYGRYLAKQGLKYNPARRFAHGYGGHIAGAKTNIQNSYTDFSKFEVLISGEKMPAPIEYRFSTNRPLNNLHRRCRGRNINERLKTKFHQFHLDICEPAPKTPPKVPMEPA